MNQPLPESISLEAFLAWEQLQADRYEWLDSERAEDRGRTYAAEYDRGRVPVPALGLRIVYPLGDDEQNEIALD